MFQDSELETVAKALYDDVLPYHNFGHVQYVLSSAAALLNQCRAENISVDEHVVYYALLFHDAGFRDDHTELGFDTKEAYSAALAEKSLAEQDIEAETIAAVKQAILCTHFSYPCQNNNDKAVKSSDLSGLAEDYDFFKTNAVHLMQEYEIMTGRKTSWNEWKQGAADKLRLYLSEDFSLTSDNAGNRRFTDLAESNIKRMLQDQNAD